MVRYLRPADAYEYRQPRPRQQTVYPMLTEGAWEHLRSRAITLGYVRAESQTAKRMALYLTALAHPSQTWTDTRPEYLIALSEALLDPSNDKRRRKDTEGSTTELFNPELPVATVPTGPMHAIWWDPDLDTRRVRRCFIRAQVPLNYLADLALVWGIGDPYHRVFQTSRIILFQNALEAIGRQALTPSIEFPNPNPAKSPVRKWRPKEIRW